MKLATIVLLGILLLGSFAPMQAAVPAGAGHVVLDFLGVPVSTDKPTNPNEPSAFGTACSLGISTWGPCSRPCRASGRRQGTCLSHLGFGLQRRSAVLH